MTPELEQEILKLLDQIPPCLKNMNRAAIEYSLLWRASKLLQEILKEKERQ